MPAKVEEKLPQKKKAAFMALNKDEDKEDSDKEGESYVETASERIDIANQLKRKLEEIAA